MDTEIVPLGTASAVPTRERNLSSTALIRGGEVLLFDCGEGTQLQLLRAGLKRSRIAAIFITHLHGDHFFGLMGMLSTLSMLNREESLTVVGPEGLQDFVYSMPGLSETGEMPYPITFVELSEDFRRKVVFDTPEYYVEARPVEHRVFAMGYRFQEKARPGSLDVQRAAELGVTDYVHYRLLKEGRSVTLNSGRVVYPQDVLGKERPGVAFAYVTDTRPCEGGRLLAKDVNLLHHEATFSHDLLDRALETGHSTALEAAEVARGAGASRLLLSHFSARYTDATPLVEEARRIFENTEEARELIRYKLNPNGRSEQSGTLE